MYLYWKWFVSSVFLRHIIHQCTQWVKKVCDIKYYEKNIYCSSIIQFSRCDISINISVLNNFCRIWGAHMVWGFKMWFELGHQIVWYRHGYECFGGAFWVCLHRPSDDRSSRSRPNCLCWPLRLHDPVTENTTISNLNNMHFSCTVSLCYKILIYTC